MITNYNITFEIDVLVICVCLKIESLTNHHCKDSTLLKKLLLDCRSRLLAETLLFSKDNNLLWHTNATEKFNNV